MSKIMFAFAGIPLGGLVPYAIPEGIYRVILPPSFTSGIPICQPSINRFKSNDTLELESNTCPLDKNLPSYPTVTLESKAAFEPVPS